MKDESNFDIKQLINEQKKFEEEIKKTLLFQQIKSFIKEYYDTNELFDLKKAISDFTKFEEFEIPNMCYWCCKFNMSHSLTSNF